MCIIPPSRQVFPCGLVQPAGAFRASVDALLLARFATVSQKEQWKQNEKNTNEHKDQEGPKSPQAQGWYFADLGTGCGIVACAVALAHPHARGLGLEREVPLVQAAQHNIRHLALEDQLKCVQADLSHKDALRAAGVGAFDLVLANPPYRVTGRGRPAAHPLRGRALEGDAGSLGHFFAAAAILLRHHGYFACVLAAARLGDAVHLLRHHNLGLRRLCCVHSTDGGPANRILLEARKHAAEDVTIEAPILAAQVAALSATAGLAGDGLTSDRLISDGLADSRAVG